MAAVQHRSRHHHKPSNPFSDYPKHPPPPPPKSSKPSSRTSAAVSKSNPTNDITEAVRDTVVLRGQSDGPRNRPTRAQTAVTSPSNNNSHPTHTRRSQSQDSGGIAEKSRHRRNNGKKGSQHADVIDRLDITGVGTMFHHDGPFDACAPSRNRQRNMAPIHSWSPTPDQDQFAVLPYGDSAYPGAHAYAAFSDDYPEPPKKKVDAIAEAWGIHEPEPYEEFLAGGGKVDTPASSIYNGRDSHTRHTRRGRDAKEEHPSDGYHAPAGSSRPRIMSRRTVPPPQPIFVPDPIDMGGEGSPGPPGTPKRSKSLMQRIRRMRDTPNVPVGSDNEAPSSPGSPNEQASYATRPTHRPQNSFLGRFGAGNKSNTAPPYSPGSEKPEPYVLIDAHNKQLPATPGPNPADMASYDAGLALSYADGNSPPTGGAALGRKTSLIQKVGRAVRGK
jgi:hypothetical protein